MLAQGNHEHPESDSQQAENDIEAWFPGLKMLRKVLNGYKPRQWVMSTLL